MYTKKWSLLALTICLVGTIRAMETTTEIIPDKGSLWRMLKDTSLPLETREGAANILREEFYPDPTNPTYTRALNGIESLLPKKTYAAVVMGVTTLDRDKAIKLLHHTFELCDAILLKRPIKEKKKTKEATSEQRQEIPGYGRLLTDFRAAPNYTIRSKILDDITKMHLTIPRDQMRLDALTRVLLGVAESCQFEFDVRSKVPHFKGYGELVAQFRENPDRVLFETIRGLYLEKSTKNNKKIIGELLDLLSGTPPAPPRPHVETEKMPALMTQSILVVVQTAEKKQRRLAEAEEALKLAKQEVETAEQAKSTKLKEKKATESDIKWYEKLLKNFESATSYTEKESVLKEIERLNVNKETLTKLVAELGALQKSNSQSSWFGWFGWSSSAPAESSTTK